ncbi:ABC transporter ATP-binding protein [bacterium]|nr:ABC transporter ATP-binding protein [bacterium]
MNSVIELQKMNKIYKTGEIEVHAVNDVSFTIERGEFTAIAGPSGSGKTTLLNMMSGLESSTSGSVILAGQSIAKMSASDLSDFRRDHIGFIFQSYNLIPVLSVQENIEYIMLLQGIPKEERRQRVSKILSEVGLSGVEKRFPPQLSGGQQQRVAVARAIVSHPDIILADEPTANLDSKSGSDLLDMMKELNTNRGVTFLFSTHDSMIMERATRLITLHDGAVASDVTK